MDNTSRYVTGMILAAAIVILGGYFFLRGAVRTVKHADFDMSYNMPRPKSALYNFFFGLEGREIERTEVNPFKDKKATDTKTAAKGKNVPKIDPKKDAAKKAADTKAATTANAAKKAEVKVNVVESGHADPLKSGALDPNAQAAPQGGAAANNAANTGAAGDNNNETMSAAQWRALVVGQPTKENVMKLIAAFNNKEVDANTLYLIMSDLMQSSNAETQSMGLLIGQSVPSLKSFSIVADNYDKLDANTKKSADTYMATYMQGSRLSILALALQSEDTKVVTHAAQVMVNGLSQVKSGQTGTAGGTRTDQGRGVVASSSGNSYAQFVSIFQNLAKDSDATIAGLAQNALTQIQSLSNT